ncbi:MAG: hydroxymethylbilane synthase [Pelagibacteraceae bacterium]
MRKITIGARGSKLSLAYVAKVKELLLEKNSDLKNDDIIIKTIKTSGDIFHDKKLSEIGGKNLFCKEIEEKLLNNKIDLAIHSLKDMESKENDDLLVGAYIKRNDPRDVFISKKYKNLEELKTGSTIGSSSRRRELQLKLINPNIFIKNIRGNIDTRIKKVEDGELDAIILAGAGVKSLNLEKKIKQFFNVQTILPAVGQGIIAVQCRKNDDKIKTILHSVSNNETMLCALAEREMLKVLDGDCDTAIGGYATLEKDVIRLRAQLFSDDGKKNFIFEDTAHKNDFLKIGKKVGENILKLAGASFKR